jgi:23S rRNA maturation-related 3'-5' exoribonuclease YhaM
MKEGVKERYEMFKTKVTTRKAEFSKFIEFLETKTQWLTAPASYKESFHLCHEGGLLEHSVNVAETMLKIRDTLAPEITDEQCVIVGLLHDCGKVGSAGVPRFLPNTDQWQIKNRGVKYTINQDLVYMNLAAKSLFLIAQYIPLTDEEAQAIFYHDGQYVEANKDVAHRETKLTLLVTLADTWS